MSAAETSEDIVRSHILFTCAVCAEPVIRHEKRDGSATWSCACGRTHGISLATGELDIGLVSPPMHPIHVFGEWLDR